MQQIAASPYRRVYVWELPVRFYHWINAVCVLLLIGTGILIYSPFSIGPGTEAYQQYWFGKVRFIHFVTAYVYFFNFIFRCYWGFVGNEHASWRNFIPHTKAQFNELLEILRADILLVKVRGAISIGHNFLAGLTYFLSFLVFLFQAITGFGLYASMSSSWFPQLFRWVIPMMGGDANVRFWHHTTMWFFILFIVVHVYIVFYHDYIEGRGTTSSMVGGWKFEREDVIAKHSGKD